MVSACCAASSRPGGDAPACAMVGRYCGDGAVFSGPRDLKYLPSKSTVLTFL